MKLFPSVGSKVRIDPNLQEGNDYAMYVNTDMVQYAGKCFTVDEAYTATGVDVVSFAGLHWHWSLDMLVPTQIQTKRRSYARPT
jgi:hypothetical protein